LHKKAKYYLLQRAGLEITNYDIQYRFGYLKQFEQTKQQELEQKDRPKIGYKPSKE